MENQNNETAEEKAKRERQEYIDLLKMKQGIIDESELIPEINLDKVQKPHGWAKFKNFCYHSRVFLICGACLAVVVAVCLVQILSKGKNDLYVLAVSYIPDSGLGDYTEKIEKTLEQYCPDFDGNGKVKVEVNFADKTVEAVKAAAELDSAEAQMIIGDYNFTEWLTKNKDITSVFVDQSDKCSENMLYKDCGILMNQTELAEKTGWKDCPDYIFIFVRNELNNDSGKVKRNAENRERALIVLQNILDNNIVNPVAESE